MVEIFWVLSGVALSLKPLKLARSQAWDRFSKTLFSSVFRRMSRLYLPILMVQTGVLIATLLGMFNLAHARLWNWPYAGSNEPIKSVFESSIDQVLDWMLAMWTFANPFALSRPRYGVHLWTISLEFQNSIVLFTTQLGLSKLKSPVRIVLMWALTAYCILVNRGDVALFIAGMGIAEYMLIQNGIGNIKSLPMSSKATFLI